MANEIPRTEVSQHELNTIAEHIEKLAAVGAAFHGSRLKAKTVLVLLNHMTKVPQRDIEIILNALPLLEREYLKPEPVATSSTQRK